MGLFFPLVLFVIQIVSKSTSHLKKYSVIAIVMILGISSLYSNTPSREEQFTHPSITSLFIQSHLPDIYNPPIPIFVGRYSGIGEALSVSGVVGPDCKKMVVLEDSNRTTPISPARCLYSQAALENLVNRERETLKKDAYVRISNSESNLIKISLTKKTIDFQSGGSGTQLLGSGWSGAEPWGNWSDAKRSEIFLPCLLEGKRIHSLNFTFNTFGKQDISILARGVGKLIENRKFNGVNQNLNITLPSIACVADSYHLFIDIPDAVSPLSLGQSLDPRELGIGLLRIAVA